MKKSFFEGPKNFEHGQKPKVGVLLTNLGTPDEPTTKGLRRYLKQFLADTRVIEEPRLKWWLVLNLIILNLRPRKSAKLYRAVWTEQGSPLLAISQQQLIKVRQLLAKHSDTPFVVELGMRYGNPSIRLALENLRAAGVDRLLVLPLYPQYSSTTTGSTFDALAEVFTKWRWLPELRMAMSYHDDPLYIEALANSVRDQWDKHGRAEKLVMSFHGIPKRYFEAGDPYHCLCRKTGRLVAEKLGLTEGQYIVTFQSLFGKEEWLRPYTDETMERLAKEGVKSLEVMCPGFSADCLETLEEIEGENKHIFMEHGGEHFYYIPALNDREDSIKLFSELILRKTSDWQGVLNQVSAADLTTSRQEYDKMAGAILS